jgi:hypothetical protein
MRGFYGCSKDADADAARVRVFGGKQVILMPHDGTRPVSEKDHILMCGDADAQTPCQRGSNRKSGAF